MTTKRTSLVTRIWYATRIARVLGMARTRAPTIAEGFCIGVMATGLASMPAAAAERSPALSSPLPLHEGTSTALPADTLPLMASESRRANFLIESASPDAVQLADWVVNSGDNRSLPFVIVDKRNAEVFVFDNEGRLLGAAPALLGLAQGDHSVPGIGDRKLSTIRPEERTTPAGRFMAALGKNLAGQEILWVDYDAAVSLHRVVTTNPKERRLQRLATPSPFDNRVSYGCINVPVEFYETIVSPSFTGTNGIVYVLPETRSSSEVFPLH